MWKVSAQEGTLPAGAGRPMEWGSEKGEGFATLPFSLAKRIAILDLSTGESDTPPTHMEVFCTTKTDSLGGADLRTPPEGVLTSGGAERTGKWNS